MAWLFLFLLKVSEKFMSLFSEFVNYPEFLGSFTKSRECLILHTEIKS